MTDLEHTAMDRDDYRIRATHGLAGLPADIDALVDTLPSPFVHALGVELSAVRQAPNYATAQARGDVVRALIRGYALGEALPLATGEALLDYVTKLEASRR